MNTSQIINVKAFCDSIESFDGVNYAETNFTAGDANRIKYARTGNNMYYDFTVGWGDCPSGCTNRYTWQFLVNYSDCSVEYLGVNFINGAPSEPMPAPINCNISGNLSTTQTEKNNWRIYPSPANDQITIESQENGIIEITTMNGSIIYTGTIETTNERIDISNFSSGMYVVKLQTAERVFVDQIIKQ